MKVLFAIRDEKNIIAAIENKYQQEYGKKITCKQVKDFTAMSKELQKNVNYDKIVIDENIDNNAKAKGKDYAIKRIKNICKIADSKKIIYVTNDKSNLSNLVDLGIYNVVIGEEKIKRNVYNLIVNPNTKKQAIDMYNIKSKENVKSEVKREEPKKELGKEVRSVSKSKEKANTVKKEKISTIELFKNIKYLNKNDLEEEKCIKRFNNLYSKLDKDSLNILIQSLEPSTKKILKKGSKKYNEFLGTDKKSKQDEEEVTATPAKKRGRPRKVQEDNSVEEEPTEKKRRGRPRKVEVEENDKKQEVKESIKKEKTKKEKLASEKAPAKNKETAKTKKAATTVKKSKDDDFELEDIELDDEVVAIPTKKNDNKRKKEEVVDDLDLIEDDDLDLDDEELDENALDLDLDNEELDEDDLDLDDEELDDDLDLDDEELDDDDLELEDEELDEDDLDLDDEELDEDDLDLDDEELDEDDLDLDNEELDEDDLDLDDEELDEDDLDLDDEELDEDDLDLDDEELDEDDLDLDDEELDEDDLDLDDEELDEDDLDLDDEELDEDDLDLDDEELDKDDLDLDDEELDEDDLDLDDENLDEDDLDLDDEELDDFDFDDNEALDENVKNTANKDDILDLDDDDIINLDDDSDDDIINLDDDSDDDIINLDDDSDDDIINLDDDSDDDIINLDDDSDDDIINLDDESDDDIINLDDDSDDDIINLDDESDDDIINLDDESDDDIINLDDESDDDIINLDDDSDNDDDILSLDDDSDDQIVAGEDDNSSSETEAEDSSDEDLITLDDAADEDDDGIISLDDDDDAVLKLDDDADNGNEVFSGIKNKNYNPNYDLSKQISAINDGEEAESETTNVMHNINLSEDKKVVAFVGGHGNGTSFIVNNLASLLSGQGIKVAILDLTKNRNSYYIYTENEESLRSVAFSCFDKLKSGIPDGIKTNKNLTVYTTLPNSGNEIEDIDAAINTLLSNHSLVLLDCDVDTDKEFFAIAQEIYLVQSLDILTIQPLTSLLKKLKMSKVLDESKIRILVNKDLRVNDLNDRILISAMSVYNSPDTTYQLDLFNRDTVQYLTIPFEEKNYAKYLSELAKCKLKISGYSKPLISSFNKLAKMVYPIGKKKK